MVFLGGLRGTGILTCGDQTIARVDYDIDGYEAKSGEITGSGEIRCSQQALRAAFGRQHLRLLTDDGRILELRFTEKRPGQNGDAAHVDVAGQLPARSQWFKPESFSIAAA